MWTTLHFEGRSKKKNRRRKRRETGNICKGTPDTEFEQDWSVGLDATLRDRQKNKTIFLVSRIFPGKAEGVILLGSECTINSLNLIKIVIAVFSKTEI